MIDLYKYPRRNEWSELVKRPTYDSADFAQSVRQILSRVKSDGDTALINLTKKFDNISLKELKVDPSEIDNASDLVSDELKRAIDQAYHNILNFHSAQKTEDITLETQPGVICSLKHFPIQKVGLYIPGGSAPLFSTVLMLAVPALLAKCEKIILCTPPAANGKIHPAILYAARICGVEDIFKVGGAQAVAAMAYGTKSISKVDKIFGPGNQFVTLAKQFVNMEGIAIDMPAGPSELLIFADETSVPEFVAADLLSQAEHGIDSQVIMLSLNEILIEKVKEEVKKQIENLPRKATAHAALNNSKAILFSSAEEAFEFVNEYAPEHLIIASDNASTLAEKVKNAGSVFLGNYTPESAGDYASGTNHTLPTNGAAKAYSGITLQSFMKTITFQHVNKEGIRHLSPTVECMAEGEQLEAHRNAMAIRREEL